jgi:hypothetical protein
MLSYIDPILFPDKCEILEISPGQYVYNIFKNGSSSLRMSGLKSVPSNKFDQLEIVQVFLRDPLDRYVSGVETYISTLPDNQDKSTVLSMIDQYLFLNSHFSLQFHWLVNLARHTPALIHIKSLDQLSLVTNMHRNSQVRDQQLYNRFTANEKLQFYLELDKILINDFMNQTVTLKDIVAHIRQQRPEVYQEVILRSKHICSVLD